MGLLTTAQARIPTRTSYPGRNSSLSGRRDKRSDISSSWSLQRLVLPLTLLIITAVAVVGIFKVEHLAQHITGISRPTLHRSTPHPSSFSSSSSSNHAAQAAAATSAASAPPSDASNTAAEPEGGEATTMSASLMEDDEDNDDNSAAEGEAIQAPAMQFLGLGSGAANAAAPHDPAAGQQHARTAFETQLLGSPNSNQQQQQLLGLTAAPAEPAAPAAPRAPVKPPVSRAPNKRHRLLLATHSRLMWYYPDTDDYQILHEGEGVHYGMFPGAGSQPSTVWTAIRPHNWRPASNSEFLVELDMETGAELQRVRLPSRFTHDVVRHGNDVFVCDTGNGRILQLSFPNMTPVRSMDLFSLRDHPNTLAPLGPDNFLVVLHNLGNSDVVRVNVSAIPPLADPQAWLAQQFAQLQAPGPDAAAADSAAGPQIPITKPAQAEGAGSAVLGRVQRVGQKAHGLVPWQGAYIMLDSDSGALVALDLTGAAAGEGFQLVTLWKTPEAGTFLKGLAVVDDVAYFGISPWAPRSARDDPQSNNELAAFDLISGQLLWRREVPTAGLLNVVGAPHLAEGSTYLPSYTGRRESDAVRKHHTSPEVAVAMRSLTELGYPPVVGGYWSSGLPYLDTSIKATKRPWEAGLQLPLLMLNISDLQSAIAALPAEAWTYDYQARTSAVMAGREGNQAAFKPGVEGIVLLFSANDGSGPVFKFPAYDYFAPVLEPLLEEIVGKRDMRHIIRLQLALMKPGVSDIKIHVDSGGYAIRGHRIHIPVFTHPHVSFDVCPHRYEPDPSHVPAPGEPQRLLDIQECFKVPTVEGFVFELNNRAAHKVSNLSPVERVHVVFDLCEEPHPRVEVPAGTVCDYDMEKGLLCRYPDGALATMVPELESEASAASQYAATPDPTATADEAAGEVLSEEAEEAREEDAAAAADDGQDGWETDAIMMPVEPVSSVVDNTELPAASAFVGSAADAQAGSSSGYSSLLQDADEALAPSAYADATAQYAAPGAAGADGEDGGSEDNEDDVRAPVPSEFQQLSLGGGSGLGGAAAGGRSGLYDADDDDGVGGVLGQLADRQLADRLLARAAMASKAVGGLGGGVASVRRLQAAGGAEEQQ